MERDRNTVLMHVTAWDGETVLVCCVETEINSSFTVSNRKMIPNFSSSVSVGNTQEPEHKVMGLFSDNCNMNFGQINMRGENNVYRKVSWRNCECGLCCIYSIQLLQTSAYVLPTDIEILVVKIYKYFHTCTGCIMQLKSFSFCQW
jgi:hypothetical protein